MLVNEENQRPQHELKEEEKEESDDYQRSGASDKEHERKELERSGAEKCDGWSAAGRPSKRASTRGSSNSDALLPPSIALSASEAIATWYKIKDDNTFCYLQLDL